MNYHFTGDKRVNVWAGLTSIHTAFVRQHNVIAKSLYDSLKNSSSSMTESEMDERAYKEARRIIAAILQVRKFTNETFFFITSRKF